ncbi:MAG: hypothetical protein AAGA56_07275 [Myxococcota bacterium]
MKALTLRTRPSPHRSSALLVFVGAFLSSSWGNTPPQGGKNANRGSGVAHAAEPTKSHWVVAQLTTTAAKVPVVGTIYAKTKLLTLHDITERGNRLRGPGSLCSIDIDSGSRMVSTRLPDRFKRSLPQPYIDAVIDERNGKKRIRTGRRQMVVGAKLDQPNEPLPTRASDSRVVDQDGDGKPGVTILIDGIVSGEIYVAQRSWTRFLGSMKGRDSFSGKVYFNNEQSILGATSSMLDDAPDAQPVVEKSWFKMVKVSSSTTCEDAKRMAATWF